MNTSIWIALIVSLTAGPDENEKPVDPVLEAYRQQVLKTTGDAARGKIVFESDKAACTKCHTTDDGESKAGPKLRAIAEKFNREGLVDAVLKPSMGILAGYTAKVIVTTSGVVHTGIVRTRGEEVLELAIVTGELVRVPVAEISQEANASVSLMPAGLHQQLSHQDVADVIAYLGTLKQPPDPRRSFATPDGISILEKQIRLEPIHDASQRFEAPLWFDALPGTTDAYVVLDQRKGVFLLEKTATGMRKTLFLDMSKDMYTGEFWGVMGMAFHPQFLENRKYYLDRHTKGKLSAIVVERQATEDYRSDAGVPSRLVLKIDQEGHMGGMLLFGPDGYLYVGTGDGGPQEDPHGHAQDMHILDGSILRIDVDGRDPGLEYTIPKSNPFVKHPDPLVRREIWAYGIRNAWRFSFDPATGDFWLGDVGQVTYEEVSIVRAGDNLGWNIYEGFMPFSDGYESKGAKYVPPLVSLGRKHGLSVTGGYVYRGKRNPSYNGVYIFGDFESKRIWGMTQSNRKLTKIRQIGTAPGKIVSFGEDSEGEIYVVGYDDGMIYRVRLEESVFD